MARQLLRACATWEALGRPRPGELQTVLAQALALKRGRLSIEGFHQRLDAFFDHLDRRALIAAADYPAIRQALRAPGGYKRQLLHVDGRPVLSLALRLAHHEGLGFDFLVLRRGEQIPPHGHRGAVSGFYLLEGRVAIRHYHAVQETQDHVLLRLTVDKILAPGGYASESELRDNIHWLCGLDEASILFRMNVKGLPNVGAPLGWTQHAIGVPDTRLYVDPRGKADERGLIRGRFTDAEQAKAIPPFSI